MLKKKFMKYGLMKKHMELVRKGKYQLARKILNVLKNETVYLGLSDTEWETEEICEEIGMKIKITRRGKAIVLSNQF
ncbi:hypothetical protein [Crassaminicella profunda]|uniref:hypothetical protein n=1 Tax=Crassaminicella profunda TaxID=1286698 RepID=UPI001CA5F776|nr:hypothetical protein [Crassaminicella profunda]QZY56678.1 hypothetical protein K7H06_07085 [Crassaminicella profunda]